MPLSLCLHVPNRADDTCACPIFHMSIERLDVTTSPSQASRAIPKPCRSIFTWCFRLSLQQPVALHLRVTALSLPSRPPSHWMIPARVRSFSCLSNDWMSLFRLHELAGRFQSLVAPFYSVFPIEPSTTGGTTLARYRSFFAFASPVALDDTCACPIFHMSMA